MSRLFKNLSSLAFVLMVCLFTLNANAQDKKNSKDYDSIYTKVDKPAEILIGEEALKNMLAENLKYPQEAKEKGIQGPVFISLVIEKDGSFSEIKIKRGLGYGLDEEAIRLVRLMQKWIPARQNKIMVRSIFDLPVKFSLSEEGKESVDFICFRDERIFTVYDHQTSFPGGEVALKNYINAMIQIPKEAKENGIKGNVVVTFVVEKDGSLSNIKLVRKLGYGCDEEAIRIVKAMPNWEPGKERDELVRSLFTLPITFN